MVLELEKCKFGAFSQTFFLYNVQTIFSQIFKCILHYLHQSPLLYPLQNVTIWVRMLDFYITWFDKGNKPLRNISIECKNIKQKKIADTKLPSLGNQNFLGHILASSLKVTVTEHSRWFTHYDFQLNQGETQTWGTYLNSVPPPKKNIAKYHQFSLGYVFLFKHLTSTITG